MDAEAAAVELGRLFGEVYQYCYPRRSPRAYRVSPESLALLHHLDQAGPLTVTEMAAHFDRSQAAMSEIVGRLSRRGLLDRIEDDRDRRRHFVWLTPRGLALVKEASQPLHEPLVVAAMSRLTAADREQLIRSLHLFVATSHDHARTRRKKKTR